MDAAPGFPLDFLDARGGRDPHVLFLQGLGALEVPFDSHPLAGPAAQEAPARPTSPGPRSPSPRPPSPSSPPGGTGDIPAPDPAALRCHGLVSALGPGARLLAASRRPREVRRQVVVLRPRRRPRRPGSGKARPLRFPHL